MDNSFTKLNYHLNTDDSRFIKLKPIESYSIQNKHSEENPSQSKYLAESDRLWDDSKITPIKSKTKTLDASISLNQNVDNTVKFFTPLRERLFLDHMGQNNSFNSTFSNMS